MLRRMLLVAAVTIAGASAVAFFLDACCATGRTLSLREMQARWGGEPNNLCCADHQNCFGVGLSCGDAQSQEECENGQVDVQIFAGNKKACLTTYPGKTCSEGTSYVCKKIWNCTWETEPAPARCVTTGNPLVFSSPSSCTDDCL